MRLPNGTLPQPVFQNPRMATQLTTLPEVERLSPGCIRILGGNPGKFTLQGTNTYLVGTGATRLLIDTGEGKPSWIAALKRVLAEEKASITSALITHWHHDHTSGIPDLLAACPGTKIYKHQPDPGQLDIPDGHTFSVPGASLTAVHTPGHTTDHTVFVWQGDEEGGVFTGDSVLGHGTAVFEDLGAYLSSLERTRHLFKKTSASGGSGRGMAAYPGHGAVVPDGPGKIDEYIRHRAQREEQVVQTLRSSSGRGDGSTHGSSSPSSWTVMELVRSIYRDVPERLHTAAAGGVAQILGRLQREGRVKVVDGDGTAGDERWALAGSGGSGRSVL